LAVSGWPTSIALAKRSGTQKSTMMRERSSIVAMGDCVVTWSPTSLGRMPTTPEIGDTMVRRASASSASRNSSLALSSATSASITWTPVALLEERRACMRSSVVVALLTAILARSTAISSESESSLPIVSPALISWPGATVTSVSRPDA
jgi:hypothetical protein